jgi:hypothetical protein
MQQINSRNFSNPDVIEAEFRRPDVRSHAEKLAETSYKRDQEVLKVNLNSTANPKQDTFVRDFTVSAVSDERRQNTNQRRATEAYGADALREKLAQTRESLITNRDNLNANKSLAFRPGMNQLALA